MELCLVHFVILISVFFLRDKGINEKLVKVQVWWGCVTYFEGSSSTVIKSNEKGSLARLDLV